MPFYILSHSKIFEHQFSYLSHASGRRLEPTLVPGTNPTREKSAPHTWAIEVMSKSLISLSAKDSAQKALDLMEKHQIHHLPITEGDAILGIVSDRDLLKIKDRSELLKTQLELDWFMSKIIVLCHEETPIDHIARVFCQEQINGILVINSNKKLTGVITHHDLLKWIYDGHHE